MFTSFLNFLLEPLRPLHPYSRIVLTMEDGKWWKAVFGRLQRLERI